MNNKKTITFNGVVKEIVFVNLHAHGDFYIPSKFVEDFASKINNKVYFAISKDLSLLKIDNVNIIGEKDLPVFKDSKFITIEEKNRIYINLWIAALWKLGLKLYLNLKDHYSYFKNYFFDKYHIQMNDIEYYIPETKTVHRDTIIQLCSNKNLKVLLCNGHCTSGQVPNFSFNQIVDMFQNKDILFYATHSNLISTRIKNRGNIFSIDNLYDSPNLHEIAEFAKHCDIIIGRDSGLFYWCQNKDTLEKKFICYTGTEDMYRIYDGFNVKPIFFNDIDAMFDDTFKIILTELSKKMNNVPVIY